MIPHEEPQLVPLAVVGLAQRYPGDAGTEDSFWDMLMEKRCAYQEYPPERLNINGHYHPDMNQPNTLSVRRAHFIEGDLAAFDASFFSLTAEEAKGMDPQQRLALETTYHALENAGLSLEKVSGTRTCVFTGCSSNDYGTFHSRDPEYASKYVAFGQTMSMLANRISWFFNFSGPSANVDTACSSSLMALDLACQSIWSGSSAMGIVNGTNLMITREWPTGLGNLGFSTPDGRCFSFDHRANGYARGDGVGVLVIKPVQDAIRDGDTIRAVIRSTFSNQDGRTPGITLPSRQAQSCLIKAAYERGGLDPAATRYFEAHGTGTPVGDPIETRAIGAIFRCCRSKEDPLYIGSVKSNIGHLEGGSGVAGVIKVILALERGIIPPNSNFEKINPKIDCEHLNLKIPSEATAWPPGLRRASVNSFGFGGANSHAVLDDAYHYLQTNGLRGRHNTVLEPLTNLDDHLIGHIEAEIVNPSSKSSQHLPDHATSTVSPLSNGQTNGDLDCVSNIQLLTWSAADEGGIKRLSDAWQAYFDRLDLMMPEIREQYLREISFTLNTRRTHLPWRTYAIIEPGTDFSKTISQWEPPISSTISPKLGFTFTGQGAQWPAMGHELIYRYPVFQESLLEANKYLQTQGCEWDLFEELLKDITVSSVNDPDKSQPLCTALQVALVDLLSTFGLTPAAVIGHSSGEIAAAYCARAISRESAWKLAYYRGALAAKLAQSSRMEGSMMAVGISKTDVEPYLQSLAAEDGNLRVVLACVNSPSSITLSGDATQISTLKRRFDSDQIFSRALKVPVAYHSFQMQEIAAEYEDRIKQIDRSSTEDLKNAPLMVSSVSGTWISAEELLEPAYWVRNLVSTVQFSDAQKTLFTHSAVDQTMKLDGSHQRRIPIHSLLEIGPHPALRVPSQGNLNEGGNTTRIQYIPTLVQKKNGVSTILKAAALLHCTGFPVNLSEVNQLEAAKQKATMTKLLTNIPPYPFNHTKTYWAEGPVSKGFRLRQYGRHELLGYPDDDWNPLAARWNNILRSWDPVWVKDHKISGTILLPGVSFIVMAIEAMKQVLDTTDLVTGFKVSNVDLKHAIKVPMDQELVRTQFHLQPRQESKATTSWYDFSLYSNSEGDGWVKNCVGSVQATYSSASNKITGDRVLNEVNIQRLLFDAEISKTCTKALDVEHSYKHLESCGYQYGSLFKPLTAAAVDQSCHLVAKVGAFQTPPRAWNDTYTIHPTTFDGILQTVALLLSDGSEKDIPTSIPTHIDDIWLSNTSFGSPSAECFNAATTLYKKGRREFLARTCVLNEERNQVILTMDGIKFSIVGSEKPSNATQPGVASQLCHRLEWKPDLSLMDDEQIQAVCEKRVPESTDRTGMYINAGFIITAFSRRAVHSIRQRNWGHCPSHIQRHLEWIESQDDLLEAKESPFSSDYWKLRMDNDVYFQELCDRFSDGSQQGKAYVEVGRNLLRFVEGDCEWNEAQPLKLVQDMYEDMCGSMPGFLRLLSFLDILAHKNPGMRILQLDSGIVPLTRQMINSISTNSKDGQVEPRYAQFHITGSFKEGLDSVQEACQSYAPWLGFYELDIEKDLEIQGFSNPGTYDLIVASTALWKSSDIPKALANIRKLLRTGGKFVFLEMSRPGSYQGAFVHGWLHQLPSVCSRSPELNSTLTKNGFSGFDILFPDYKDPACHELTFVVTTATEDAQLSPSLSLPSNIVLLYDPTDLHQERLARDLETRLPILGHCKVQKSTIDLSIQPDNVQDCLFISILESSAPKLHLLDKHSFHKLQKLLTFTRRLLWVSNGGGHRASPFYHLADGLFRVLNSEDSRAAYTKMDFEGNTHDIANQAEKIVRIARETWSSPVPETEYLERDGHFCINRLTSANDLNEAVHYRSDAARKQIQSWASGPALKLQLGPPGQLDNLHFVEDRDRYEPLSSGCIEVKVKSVGINFRDILIALGRLEQDEIGFECAGIVTRVSKDSGNFQPGDHVIGIGAGTFRNYARIKSDNAVKMAPGMSFTDGAAIPINFYTAWHGLHEIARIQPEESVLIHSAAGGTGQAAVQIAQHLGATIFATVGSTSKKQMLMDRYGISEARIFSSRDTTFLPGIKQLTGGNGVDVVFNSLSGEGLEASWNCIAPFGRFIEIGKADILSNKPLNMYPFNGSTLFAAIDTDSIMRYRPKLIHKSMKAVMERMAAGVLSPPQPLQIFGISDLEKALRSLQTGQNSGKTVVEMRNEDLVPTILTKPPSHHFNPNATYAIAGGFGGLGRGIARWLVQHGARNLLLLSRCGPQTEEAKTLVNELIAQNINFAAPACDISNISMLEAVLGEISCTMPPVKGCIQATMVLRDTMFEQMQFDQWKDATWPKVQGSWNLHELLPSGLDFFIMLSSISGIMGNRGQANYAAGNTFMDALAHHRVSLGERSTSLNLGFFLSAGVVKETAALQNRYASDLPFTPVTEPQLHSLLAHYCDPSSQGLDHTTCQPVVGIGISDNVRRRGFESAYWLQKPEFQCLMAAETEGDNDSEATPKGHDQAIDFRTAESLSEANSIVTDALIKKLSKILVLSSEKELDANRAMASYGIDSLIAVEIRNWFSRELNVDMAIFDLLGGTTIAAVAAMAASKGFSRKDR